MTNAHAIQAMLANRALTKSVQVLLGIITGIVSDGHLHDLEIQMLNTWLSANEEVTTRWPGSAIARHLQIVLADGVITEDERTHLLQELQRCAGIEFAETGSVSPEVASLPYDMTCVIEVRDMGICHTGEFIFGTRAACERLTTAAGGICHSNITKKTAYLVVGTHVSPAWANTSYGRKIERAMTLKNDGHHVAVVSEKRWLEVLQIRT